VGRPPWAAAGPPAGFWFQEKRPKKGIRHEALDARVYAYAALRALVSMGLVLDAEAERTAAEGGPVREEAPTVMRIRHSRWMQG